MSNHVGYSGIETAFYLTKAYELLSNSHRNAYREAQDFSQDESINYYCGPALLSINASIIEGTLRSILAVKLEENLDELVRLEQYSQVTLQSLQKARYEVELQGGWEKLKEQYSAYLDLSLKNMMGKTLYESFEVLFIIRNIVAHGTTFIEPLEAMSDHQKNLYPYKWQGKLQRANQYFKKEFEKDSLLEALKIYSLPEHFLEKTRQLVTILNGNFSDLTPRIKATLHEIQVIDFGRKKLYYFL